MSCTYCNLKRVKCSFSTLEHRPRRVPSKTKPPPSLATIDPPRDEFLEEFKRHHEVVECRLGMGLELLDRLVTAIEVFVDEELFESPKSEFLDSSDVEYDNDFGEEDLDEATEELKGLRLERKEVAKGRSKKGEGRSKEMEKEMEVDDEELEEIRKNGDDEYRDDGMDRSE